MHYSVNAGVKWERFISTYMMARIAANASQLSYKPTVFSVYLCVLEILQLLNLF